MAIVERLIIRLGLLGVDIPVPFFERKVEPNTRLKRKARVELPEDETFRFNSNTWKKIMVSSPDQIIEYEYRDPGERLGFLNKGQINDYEIFLESKIPQVLSRRLHWKEN